MSKLYAETALPESVIYKKFSGNGEIMKNVISTIKTSTVIDSGYIEEQLLQIDKLKISPLTEKVIDSFKIGEIRLLYSDKGKIPQFFPFITLKAGNGFVSYIFLNNFGKMIINKKAIDNSKYIDIPTKDLYALMEGAYVSVQYAKNPGVFKRNYGLMSTCSLIYTGLFNKIFNREYALVMDREAADKASFAVAKYFLTKVWGCENPDVVTQHARNVVMSTHPTTITVFNDEYDAANIQDLDGLIAFIKTISPRLAPINLRYFMQCYINQYKPTTVFSIEVLPYFFFVVQATMVGSFVVNQTMISDTLKGIKNIGTYYPEIHKSVM